MLSVHDLELRVGARLLMDEVSFRVDRGDKIGLVGRNGAGKTTLTKVLAGEQLSNGGKVVEQGGPELAVRLENEGYDRFLSNVNVGS